MNSPELRVPVIHVIISLPQIKINNINRIHFFHLSIRIPLIHIFRDRLGSPVQHPVEIIQFTVILDLYNNQLAFRIFSKHVNPVKFIIKLLLVAFTLQYPFNVNLIL